MCGIAGIYSLDNVAINGLEKKLLCMNNIMRHRGPDGEGIWRDSQGIVGLAHTRLSIIDLTDSAAQPMQSESGLVLSFNGEIYNYRELRKELNDSWVFKTNSDSEVILAAYDKYGEQCVDYLRGMFAFVIWDPRRKQLFCARDRFGIKPFYYTIQDRCFIFASEAKVLLPFLSEISTDIDVLGEYLVFQNLLGENTLFKDIKQLLPARSMNVDASGITIRKYWEPSYEIDESLTEETAKRKISELLEDSINIHLRSDAKIGSYVSGGIDSSIITILASAIPLNNEGTFHGRFMEYPGYDESQYAVVAAQQANKNFYCTDITFDDFEKNIRKVMYHLDFPCAGPGSFPQYMVSQLASERVKVVLGGQGGDELFGGYARYLVCYLEQALKSSLNSVHETNELSLNEITGSLGLLKEYVPMIKSAWGNDLFGSLEDRYCRISDRSMDMKDEVDWSVINKHGAYTKFKTLFNNPSVKDAGIFNRMLDFDMKWSLPSLLQVEDRMSMAHGLESRVPLLDHPLVEFLATIPTSIKFKSGKMKHLLCSTFDKKLPAVIKNRRDKMGFPVPLKEWSEKGGLGIMIRDIFSSSKTQNRGIIKADKLREGLGQTGQFSRKTWGLLSLELWHQEFHDKASEYQALLK